MSGYLTVKDWSEHQHYKDRTPPWIKLHRKLLTDYEFNRLQDASKAHLMLIWVLASQLDNHIPNDPKWIARKIGASQAVNLKLLIGKGFLILHSDDSKPLADCLQDATASPSLSVGSSKDIKSKSSKKRATHLPDDWQLPEDYRDYCITKRPDLDPDATAENFSDWYVGKGQSMVDWKRTWQRWVRNEKVKNGTHKQNNRTGKSKSAQLADQVRDIYG